MSKKIIVPDWFYSDGCSCYQDGNRTEACRIHDFEYWLGGSMIDKENADHNLFMNVEDAGGFLNNYWHCWVMYLGVKTWGRKSFEEREVKLAINDPELEEIYLKERTADYWKHVYKKNK